MSVSTSDLVPDFDKPLISTVALGTSKVRVCVANSQRWGLILSNPSGLVSILLPDPSITLARGIPVSATTGVLRFNFRDDAILATSEWWGIASAGNTITVVEIMYKPRR